MANPRQRRKARSSSHKPVSHSRRAKKMLKKTPRELGIEASLALRQGGGIVGGAVDPRKSLCRNYQWLSRRVLSPIWPSSFFGSLPLPLSIILLPQIETNDATQRFAVQSSYRMHGTNIKPSDRSESCLFPPSFLLDPNIFDPRFLVPNVLLLIFYPHSW